MSADYCDDYADLSKEEWVCARKNHICCACSERIETGQMYARCDYLYEKRWSHYKYCSRCWAIAEAIMEQPDSDGFVHGLKCGHSWEDVFLYPPPEHVQALAFLLPGELSPDSDDHSGS